MQLVISRAVAVASYELHHARTQIRSQTVRLLEEFSEAFLRRRDDFLVAKVTQRANQAAAQKRVGSGLAWPLVPAQPLELGTDQIDHAQPVGSASGLCALEPVEVVETPEHALPNRGV